MTYDFESRIDRSQEGSCKWNTMRRAHPEFPAHIVPFSVADMEFHTAPEIVDGLKRFIDTAVLGYSEPTDKTKEAVASWMERRHNWDVEPEWILNSAGVVPSIFSSVEEFTKPDEGVIIFTPVYHPFYLAIEHSHRTLVECPLILNDDLTYDIDFDLFERLATDPKNTLLIFCSPHNPAGRVWTEEELIRVAKIAEKYGLLVVSDEIHHDLIMPGSHHTVFETVTPTIAERTITCTSPSKSFNLAGTQFKHYRQQPRASRALSRPHE